MNKKKYISLIVTICFMLGVGNSALAIESAGTSAYSAVLYYPNANWGFTAVQKEISLDDASDFHKALLEELVDPEVLPEECYDEFPDSFEIYEVSINDDKAEVVISDLVSTDSGLSDTWLRTLENIVAYNLFSNDATLNEVTFGTQQVSRRVSSSITRSELFASPNNTSRSSAPRIDLDYVALASMTQEEQNQAIRSAVLAAVGTDRSGQASSYTVCIDPGHGGSQPGAVSGNTYESDINLTIALEMRDYLEGISAPYPTFDVVMTRTTDTDVSLGDRADIANDANADAFISIHCNSFTSSSVRGTTARYPNNHDMALSEDLGNELIEAITPSPLPKHSDAQYQNLQVLRETNMPATLMECGFMSNSEDLDILTTQGDDLGYYMGIATNVWCQINA